MFNLTNDFLNVIKKLKNQWLYIYLVDQLVVDPDKTLS